jgi:hypothetical protein
MNEFYYQLKLMYLFLRHVAHIFLILWKITLVVSSAPLSTSKMPNSTIFSITFKMKLKMAILVVCCHGDFPQHSFRCEPHYSVKITRFSI